MSKPLHHPPRLLLGSLVPFLVPFLALAGCSEGSTSQTIPQAELQVTSNHYLYSFSTPARFTDFPIPEAETTECYGNVALRADSTYEAELGACGGGEEDYALERTGRLSVITTPSARSGRVRFLGGFGLDGGTGVLYFTDRFTSSSNNGIGLFWGTRLEQGTADLEGDWHFFTQHVIHSTALTLNPNNVGRTLGGTVAIDANGDLTGDGLESTQATITLSGKAASFDENRLEMSIDFTAPQSAADTRFFRASAGTPDNAPAPTVVLGLDEDTGDGEAGLIAMLRKRTSNSDPDQLAGKFWVGIHSIFVDPSNPGSDAAHGELEFNATGEWSLTARGAGPPDFTYGGNYILSDDGSLELTVNDTNETWSAAVDEDYRMVVIADNFIEARPAGKPPELNLMLGLRQSKEEPSNP